MRNPFSLIGEMTGKISPNTWGTAFSRGAQHLFKRGNDTTIDYNKNDYDLYKAIYYASTVNGKGKEYILAAALARPIINIITGFVIGKGFTIELDNPTADKGIAAAEEDLNATIKKNVGKLFDLSKFGYRDGDSYLYIDELGRMELLSPESVDVMLDDVTGQIIGYDVKENVKIRNPLTQQDVQYVYLKQYRTDSVRYSRYVEARPENKETLYERVYTDAGVVEPDTAEGAIRTYNNLVNRRLPIIALHNEPEPKAIYGNSELQNILVLLKNYTAVLAQGTKGNIYNSTPIPVLKGVKDPKSTETASKATGDTGGGLEWDQDSVIYLTGEKSDAKFLQAQGIMDDVGKLLELYFFLIVQGSETPEFAFGTAVSSSKASTETQMPVFVGKVERKRTQLSDTIQNLVLTYMEKQRYISNVTYLNIDPEIEVRVNFPSIIDDDRKLTLDTVTWAVESGFMTGKTALELVAGDRVKDVAEEIKAAAKEAEKAAKDQTPDQQTRLYQELLAQNNGGTPTPTPTPPAPTPTPGDGGDDE